MNRTFASKEDSMDSDSEHNELEQDGLLRSRRKERGYPIQSRWRFTAKALTLLNACFATLFIVLSISSWRNKNCLPGAPPPWCKNKFLCFSMIVIFAAWMAHTDNDMTIQLRYERTAFFGMSTQGTNPRRYSSLRRPTR